YTLAAEQGLAQAQYNIGVYYDNGWGVVQNYKTASEWYTLAAEQGHAKAQYNLGLMYRNGEGVLQDNIYAHMWFNIAASSGNSNATEDRTLIQEKMTTADISKAQELARQCVNKNYKDC
ncbi:sel1 repeat family protein, partial [Alphaproteobacteria bacterium]|nr:sel1 repeat family protein [Alphaproteobacteria bacterium]